jgi:hypothetical protein
VGDALVGADRPVELLPLLGVGDRHLHRLLRDADELGRERDGDPVARRRGVSR